MKNKELAMENYARGLWTEEMLARLTAKGRLTDAAFEEITGQPYTGRVTAVSAAELDAAYREGVQTA